MKVKKGIAIIILLFLWGSNALFVNARSEEDVSESSVQEKTADLLNAYDFNEIEKQLNAMFPSGNVSFQNLLSDLLKGDIKSAVGKLADGVFENIFAEIGDVKNIFLFIVAIGLLSAFFTNFAKMFENHQIADISYYLLYLFMIIVLLKTFGLSLETCKETIQNIVIFVKILVPTFAIAIGMSGGTLSSVFFYQVIIVIIFGVESILLSVVVPIIYSYVFLVVINGITEDDKFEGLLELIKKGIQGFLKVLITLVTGFGILQTIITPVIDGVKMNAVTKVVAAIPGIGNIADSVTKMVLGSALLIKNSIGAVLLLILTAICFIPVMKLIVMTFVLKGSSAIIGIVCDKRMEKCARQVGDGNGLLLKTLITALALFLITIAIVAVATNKMM